MGSLQHPATVSICQSLPYSQTPMEQMFSQPLKSMKRRGEKYPLIHCFFHSFDNICWAPFMVLSEQKSHCVFPTELKPTSMQQRFGWRMSNIKTNQDSYLAGSFHPAWKLIGKERQKHILSSMYITKFNNLKSLNSHGHLNVKGSRTLAKMLILSEKFLSGIQGGLLSE